MNVLSFFCLICDYAERLQISGVQMYVIELFHINIFDFANSRFGCAITISWLIVKYWHESSMGCLAVPCFADVEHMWLYDICESTSGSWDNALAVAVAFVLLQLLQTSLLLIHVLSFVWLLLLLLLQLLLLLLLLAVSMDFVGSVKTFRFFLFMFLLAALPVTSKRQRCS